MCFPHSSTSISMWEKTGGYPKKKTKNSWFKTALESGRLDSRILKGFCSLDMDKTCSSHSGKQWGPIVLKLCHTLSLEIGKDPCPFPPAPWHRSRSWNSAEIIRFFIYNWSCKRSFPAFFWGQTPKKRIHFRLTRMEPHWPTWLDQPRWMAVQIEFAMKALHITWKWENPSGFPKIWFISWKINL